MTPGADTPANQPAAAVAANGSSPASTGGKAAGPGTDGGLQPENANTPSRPTRSAQARKAG
jgi:hypothetical protein